LEGDTKVSVFEKFRKTPGMPSVFGEQEFFEQARLYEELQ